MKYCSKCGAQMNDTETKCPTCGEPQQSNYEQKAQDAFSNFNNTRDDTGEYDAADIEKNKVVSLFSYFGILFFIPLVACPDSKFGRFHANQGLVFLISIIVLNICKAILNWIIGWIPVVGGIFSTIIGFAVWIFTVVMFILGIINACQGKAKELPIIGNFKLLK